MDSNSLLRFCLEPQTNGEGVSHAGVLHEVYVNSSSCKEPFGFIVNPSMSIEQRPKPHWPFLSVRAGMVSTEFFFRARFSSYGKHIIQGSPELVSFC